MHRLPIYLILLTAFFSTKGQAPAAAGFFRTDRSIYAPGEALWFSFFSLQELTGVQDRIDSTMQALYLSLIDPYKHKVILSRRLLMAGGVAAGRVTIPDTIADGRYTLAAFTGRYLHGGRICVSTSDVVSILRRGRR